MCTRAPVSSGSAVPSDAVCIGNGSDDFTDDAGCIEPSRAPSPDVTPRDLHIRPILPMVCRRFAPSFVPSAEALHTLPRTVAELMPELRPRRAARTVDTGGMRRFAAVLALLVALAVIWKLTRWIHPWDALVLLHAGQRRDPRRLALSAQHPLTQRVWRSRLRISVCERVGDGSARRAAHVRGPDHVPRNLHGRARGRMVDVTNSFDAACCWHCS